MTIWSVPSVKRMHGRAGDGPGPSYGEYKGAMPYGVTKGVSRRAGARPKRCQLSYIYNLPL